MDCLDWGQNLRSCYQGPCIRRDEIGNHGVQGRPERIDICTFVRSALVPGRPGSILLDWGIAWRETMYHSHIGRAGHYPLGNPQVHQADFPCGREAHVIRLDVAVDNALAMQVGQGIAQLQGPAKGDHFTHHFPLLFFLENDVM